MAAGISTKEKHEIEYRKLMGLRRDLAKVGISSTYANRRISGRHQGKPWSVTYDWLHASNGECCGMPCVVVAGNRLNRYLGADIVRMLTEHLKGQ